MVVVTLGARRAGVELDWLYRRYARDVQRYAQRVLRSGSDAEDVVQTTFVRALRALDRGERVERPQNWLIKIAHNECLRLLSSRKVHLELPENLSAEPAPSVSSEEFARALKVLAPAQRRALVLRELEGRSYAEIAETMGLSSSAVETLLFRARRAVREQYELGVSCEQFPELLESGDRARVRAHARVCESCAKLERQARGRKSRLSRIASSFFFPKLVAGFLATGATVAVVVAAPHGAPLPDVPPLQVDKATPAPAIVVRPPRAIAHRPVVAKPVSDTKTVSDTTAAPLRTNETSEPTIPPGPEPLPVPEPTEPGPPPVPAPPIHSAPAPEPAAPAQAPLPILSVPTPTVDVAPVVEPIVTTLQSVAPQVPVEAPVQAVQDVVQQAVEPAADALPALPNVSGP